MMTRRTAVMKPNPRPSKLQRHLWPKHSNQHSGHQANKTVRQQTNLSSNQEGTPPGLRSHPKPRRQRLFPRSERNPKATRERRSMTRSFQMIQLIFQQVEGSQRMINLTTQVKERRKSTRSPERKETSQEAEIMRSRHITGIIARGMPTEPAMDRSQCHS